MLKFFEGKKTYIVMGLTFVAGGLMACGVTIPEIVWVILGGAGLGAVRAALPKKA
jgi:hypothetical protein